MDHSRASEFVDGFVRWMEGKEDAVRPEVSSRLKPLGYTVHNTGGNNLTWLRVQEDGSEIMLSFTDNQLDGDPQESEWHLTRYDGEGWIGIHETFTLEGALRAAALIPPARRSDGSPVEETYPTVADARAALLPGSHATPVASSPDPMRYVLLAADTPARLRACDVDRVLTAAEEDGCAEQVRSFLQAAPDLSDATMRAVADWDAD